MGAVGTDPPTQAYIEFKLDSDNWSSFSRRWNILASQIECDGNYHAPQGCLQYFAGNDGQGTVEAFNYNNPSSSYIGHLQGETPLSSELMRSDDLISGDYTVCVRRERGNCAIGWTPPKYSDDKYGLSISGSSTATTSRGSCRNSQPGSASTTCKNQYIRIPDATNAAHGGAPYTFVSPTPLTSCDRSVLSWFSFRQFCNCRFCGKKLCAGRGYCADTGDHSIIYCESQTVRF